MLIMGKIMLIIFTTNRKEITMLVYVSGKYSGEDATEIEENIQTARRVAIELWELGHAVICPHLNTAHFEEDCQLLYDDYIEGDLDILTRCDVIVMLPGWEESRGANVEKGCADRLGIPVYEYPTLPDLHPTEIRCPNQSRAFLETVGRMYRTHLQKNADYSPANILATGDLGLVTRLWDKVARLMNLSGFKFDIINQHFEKPIDPKNESVEDTLMDASVYAIIGLLLRSGKWGN